MRSPFAPSATLELQIAQSLIFLHPQASTSELEPTSDNPLIRGGLVLDLPVKKRVRRLKVVLEGWCDAYGGYKYKYETTKILKKTVILEVGGLLQAGRHEFDFCFIIPSNTPPFQRSSYGRIRHYLKGTVEFESNIAPKITSAPREIWVAHNPSGPGELPEAFDVMVEHFSEDLGPIAATFSSPHLSVSSLLHLNLTIPSPPCALQITSVEAYVNQSFEVHYTDGTIARPPGQRLMLKGIGEEEIKVEGRGYMTGTSSNPGRGKRVENYTGYTTPLVSEAGREEAADTGSLSSSTQLSSSTSTSTSTSPSTPSTSTPTSILSQSNTVPATAAILSTPQILNILPNSIEFRHEQIFRLPSDDHIVPSSLESAETRIRVSHKLLGVIRYRILGGLSEEGGEFGEEKVLVLSKGVTIASCCLPLNSLLLPPYSATTPSFPPPANNLRDQCLCNLSIDELVASRGLGNGTAWPIVGTGPAQEVSAETLERSSLTLHQRDSKSRAWGGVGALRGKTVVDS